MPNHYYQMAVNDFWRWAKADFFVDHAHHPWSSLLYSTIVLYDAAGYVVKKLLWQHRKHSGNARDEMIEAALSLLGDIQSNTETHDTYSDYAKVWTTTTDRWGMRHISDDTYQFIKVLMLIECDLF